MLLPARQNCLFWKKQTASGQSNSTGRDEIGAWGDVPENKAWKFVQVGAQNWGYVAESSYTGQGDTTTSQNFLFTDDSNRIRKSFIISGNDNGAYFGDCDELKGRENETAKTDIPAWKPKLLLTKAVLPYPAYGALTAKLSGVSGKKNYKNQKYIFPYNGKTHVAPKNYPLGGQ